MTRAASSSPTMRSWLRWLLLVTVLMSALALWWPAPMTEAPLAGFSGAERPGQESSQIFAPRPIAQTAAPELSSQVLPTQLQRPTLERAEFDPFVGVVPPPPALPVQAPPPPAPPPQPTAPQINYRYLGRVVSPDGKPSVYLSRPDKDVPVTTGTRLDEGYVVEAISDDAVRLVYPALDVRVAIPIPPSGANR